MWQSPAMAMTAQAFLLTIALGHDSSPLARFIAAFLGIVVTVMSVQLMLKHRLFMATDEVLMISLERRMELATSAVDHETKVAYISSDRSEPLLLERVPKRSWILGRKSVHIWVIGLIAFAVVNLGLMIFSVADAFWGPCPWTIQTSSGTPRCALAL